MTPEVTVVVPAHDEVLTVGRLLDCLEPLGSRAEVVVVANGCTDDTAVVARKHPSRPVVLDLARPGKCAAINAGASGRAEGPVAVIDADIRIEAAGLLRLVAVAASSPAPRLVMPTAQYELRGSRVLVRLYMRTWLAIMQVRGIVIGSGVYVLNPAGWGRVAPFPEVIADDMYVRWSFSPDETHVAADVRTVVRPPSRVRDLYRQRVRVHRGVLEQRLTTGQSPQRAGRHAVLTPRTALQLIGLPWYVALTSLAKATARRELATSAQVRWRRGRD